jgi:hypothetical protein
MKARFTLILFAVCAAAAAAVYFLDVKGGAERAGKNDRSKRLVSAEEAAIGRVTVLRPSASAGAPPESLILERDGEAWRLVSPIRARGDRSAAGNLVSEIAGARSQRSVECGGAWNDYGLADPKFTVFVSAGGGDADTFLVGDRNPTGDFVYVRKPGRSEVFLTEASLAASLGKPVFDLRDRSVLDFEKDDVRRLEIRGPAGKMILERTPGGWDLRSPFEAAASTNGVDEILNRIKWAEAGAFVDESPRSTARYGLDRPFLRLLLVTGADSARKTLDIGSRAGDRYFASGGGPGAAVILVDSALVRVLERRPSDVREKRICPFESWSVKRVELRPQAGETVAFRKDTSGTWSFDPPGSDRADGPKIDDLLSRLSTLEAVTFTGRNPADAGRLGLDPAAREIVLTGENGSPVARIAFGGSRDPKTVYAMNRATGWTAAVPREIMRHLTPSRPEWAAAKASAPDAKGNNSTKH